MVVSNPSGEGEFDSERALAAIQEALDYSRRMGWVELDYLEEATFAHFQSRLAAFQPHVVHYIGHGGKNPPDAAGSITIDHCAAGTDDFIKLFLIAARK